MPPLDVCRALCPSFACGPRVRPSCYLACRLGMLDWGAASLCHLRCATQRSTHLPQQPALTCTPATSPANHLCHTSHHCSLPLTEGQALTGTVTTANFRAWNNRRDELERQGVKLNGPGGGALRTVWRMRTSMGAAELGSYPPACTGIHSALVAAAPLGSQAPAWLRTWSPSAPLSARMRRRRLCPCRCACVPWHSLMACDGYVVVQHFLKGLNAGWGDGWVTHSNVGQRNQ